MRFEDAWNDDDDGPLSEDVGDILLAVLKSKLLDPRSKQDRIKEEIKRLRACLRKAIALLPSDDGVRPHDTALSKKVKEQAEIIQEYRIQIESLENLLRNEKDVKSVLQSHVDSSKEHEEALKAEIHDFESLVEVLKADIEDLESQVVTGLDNGGGEGGSTSFKELREAKARIKELEDELKEATTVPQMQIKELDEEKNMLEGKMKAERLDSTAKLAAKDETIQQLRKKLETYEKHADDAQDLTAARQKLQEAREDAAAVRKSLDVINQEMVLIHKDQEKLVESNAKLNEENQRLERLNKELNQKTESMNAKVLEWMEQAYGWKEKAEVAERKVAAISNLKGSSQDGDGNSSEFRVDQVEAALEVQSQNPQGLFLQAVMEKSKAKEQQQAAGNKWNTFFRKAIIGGAGSADGAGSDGGDGGGKGDLLSPEEQRIKILEEQKSQLELAVAELRRENVLLKASQKGQIYEFQHKIEELNAEVQKKVHRRRSQDSLDEDQMLLEIGDDDRSDDEGDVVVVEKEPEGEKAAAADDDDDEEQFEVESD
jgi:chromosome segregation ATPase